MPGVKVQLENKIEFNLRYSSSVVNYPKIGDDSCFWLANRKV